MSADLRSVREARAHLQENLDTGLHCPCCGKWAKRYRRLLNSTMARGLVWVYRQGPSGTWVDVQTGPHWLLRSKQLPTTQLWDLVEKMPNDDPARKSSGRYRLTRRGRSFVERRLRVPKHVYEFNGEVVAYGDEYVTIREALTDKFVYEELMGTHPAPAPQLPAREKF